MAELWDPHQLHHATPTSSKGHDASSTLAPSLSQPHPSRAKRLTFYKSGDSKFGGVKMAIHRRGFKCFDALLDDLSQKVPLSFGVRTVTTPNGTHTINHLDQLQDGGCYLCSDHRPAKPIDMGLAGRRPVVWQPHHHHHRDTAQAQRPDGATLLGPSAPFRSRRVLLVKNTEPGRRRSVVLGRRTARSLRAFLEEASDAMQFHVRRLYTAEGRTIDTVQSLMACRGLLVCAGREPFSPLLAEFIRKCSEERLPGLGTRSPAPGHRISGNGARSPATQGARSPPHGARSRGSECSEGRDSRKNVNFGLETKKSIIHPRSDSSTRSTRFSLSSEKSYPNGLTPCSHSHSGPAIMNDDIEKRVVVNKDGSLSVEMKVRFRLHSNETLQWSTQMSKSHCLNNDGCQSREARPCYLQQGHSETCSDPDSGSCDPKAANIYAGAALRHPPEANHCPCCHQRREQRYDLWENPAHSNNHAPKPPHNAPRPAHTRVRQTHSSSSSSSSLSRRVVCRRSRLSSSRGDSSLGQAHVEVQEDLCMTEEVCTVNRCCSNSGATEEDQCAQADGEPLLSEGDDERALSVVSDSSHVLRALREDQDEEEGELPQSVSQCCQCESSPTSASHTMQKGEHCGSRASSIHCGVATPHSLAQGGEIDRDTISECSNCRGCKSTTMPVLPASQSSGRSHTATPKPDPRLPAQGENHGDDEDKRTPSQMSESSEGSAVSLRSNKSNLTHQDSTSEMSNIPEERGTSAMSEASNQCKDSGAPRKTLTEPAADSQERAASVASATSQNSGRSHKSGCSRGIADVEERSASARSAKSNVSCQSCISHKSVKEAEKRADSALSCQSATSKHNGTTEVEDEGEGISERSASPLSAKSEYSAKSRISHGSRTSTGSALPTNNTPDNTGNKEAEEDKILRSVSVLSAMSAKTGVSAKSAKSAKSHCSCCLKVVAPDLEDAEDAEELQLENGERATSVMSTRSHLSVKSSKSQKYTKASDRSLSPKPGDVENETERATSAMSTKSEKSFASVSNKSAKSCKPHCNKCSRTPTPCSVVEVKAEGMEAGTEEENTVARSGSVMSTKSAKSAESAQSAKLFCAQADNREAAAAETEDGDRAASAMSVNSSAVNTKLDTKVGEQAEAEEGNDERVGSALSFKSAHSSRSARSHKAMCAVHVTANLPEGVSADNEVENVADRSPSATSVTSVKSSKSHKSSSQIGSKEAVISAIVINGAENQNERLGEEDIQPSENGLTVVANGRAGSAMSAISKCSERSGRSKCRKCAKAVTTCRETPDTVNIKTPEGDNEEETNHRPPSAISAITENCTALEAHSPEPLCNAATDIPIIAVADADDQEDKIEEHPASTISSKTGSTVMAKHVANGGQGRSNSALSGLTKSGRSQSPCKTPAPQSPSPRASMSTRSPAQSTGAVQYSLPDPGDGDQETRGQSTMSVRSTASKTRCHCGASSKTQTREEEGDTTEDKEASERTPSFRSTDSKRLRTDSGTDSLGSVSLVLPEEELGDSDAEKPPSVTSRTNTATSSNAEIMDESTATHTVDMTNLLPPIHKPADIPTIKTPGESEKEEEQEEEQATERSPTAHSSRSNLSVQSGKSNKSSSKNGVTVSPKPKTEQNTESKRVKSRSNTSNGNHLEPSSKRTSSAMSAASCNTLSKTPHPPNEAPRQEDLENVNTLRVTPKPSSRLRPNSAASTCSEAKPASTEKSNLNSTTPGPNGPRVKSDVGSNSGSMMESGNVRISQTAACVEKPAEGALSHSLSAADLLRETPASRPTSGSTKGRCQRNGMRAEEGGELTPASLPNASANEVVSNWLQNIPTAGCLFADGDETSDTEGGAEVKATDEETFAREEGSPEGQNANEVVETPKKGVEGKEKDDKKKEQEVAKDEDSAKEVAELGLSPPIDKDTSFRDQKFFRSMSRHCDSSVAVMKVLLNPSLGRSNSLPEVSPVYGRKLSTSAKGLLDCLAQLQLIQPLMTNPDCERYTEIMGILHSLWLTEGKDAPDAAGDVPKDKITPPRSSSGIDPNQGGGGGESLPMQGEEEAEAAAGEGEPEQEEPPGADADAKGEGADVTPSSSDKLSSAAGSSKSPTDNEPETPGEDSSSGTPPTAPLSPLAGRTTAVDPDPTWALHLLKKLEKQFMSHYMAAMVEFKTRWDLEDNVLLDTMISELRDEVGRRIQSSVGRELKKIQGRAGRGGKAPRPPLGNLSRESTMTERRRQMLKVMKNQSPKTGDSLSDGETTGEFSDQRSDDEYCPCDACVRKKLAARPAKTPVPATPAPLMMDFDLRKILQLKRDPVPEFLVPGATPSQEDASECVGDGAGSLELEEENKNLEVVQEEEEMEESEEGVQTNVMVNTGGEGGEEVTTTDEGDDSGETAEQQEGDDEEESEEEEDICQECMASDSKAEEGEVTEKEEESGEGDEKEALGEENTAMEEEEEQEEPSFPESPPTNEADGEDSESDRKRRESNTDDDESEGGGANNINKEAVEAVEEAAVVKHLPHQYTRSSVESQSGSMEDLVPPPPPCSINAGGPPQALDPKLPGGVSTGQGVASRSQRRSRSPARVKRRQPRDNDMELEAL